LQVLQQVPQHQTIEVVKVDVILQYHQQQHQQMKSSDNMSKTVDMYQMKEKLKQSVINEIEGQIIKPDEINMSCTGKGTLDQLEEQINVDNVKKTDTFRGTDFELYSEQLYIS
jgi:hypothetical protein